MSRHQPSVDHIDQTYNAQIGETPFHFSARNLNESQFELEEVNNNHQREMQDILSDAANKIKRFKEQLATKQGQVNAEAQVQRHTTY